jgi:hypothetical protein
VKSATAVSKPMHLHDIAFQKYVLQKCGMEVQECAIMHINRQYVREENLDLDQLFVIEKVDDLIDSSIEFQSEGIENFANELALALENEKQEPKKMLGSVCNSPFKCKFKDSYCWSKLSKDSIFYFARIDDSKRKQLIEKGIECIEQISEDQVTPFQYIQVKGALDKDLVVHNPLEIRFHLQKLKYPLSFFDLETFSLAIPRYSNTRPYQNIPFQFSLHIQKSSEENSPLEHYEYYIYMKESMILEVPSLSI